MEINQVRLGWRMSGKNVYIHVRRVGILYSIDGTNFESTGGEIFREPIDKNFPALTIHHIRIVHLLQ